MLLQLVLLFLLESTALLATGNIFGYQLFNKSPSPDCQGPTPPAEVASVLAADTVASNIACAQACTLASGNQLCFAFYRTPSKACRLVRFDVLVSTWLDTALCPSSVYSLAFPAETRLSLTNCQQSSELWGGACERLFDGNTDQNFLNGHCSHTSEAINQWWQTDLSPGYYITRVQIFNRLDCCPERLNQLTISVDGVTCANYATAVPFSIRNFTCGRYGSVVKIQTPLSNGLVMCEVYIFGIGVTR